MKKISILLFALAILLVGCKKEPDQQPTTPNMDNLLQNAQLLIAQNLGGFDGAVTSALWLQQVKGVSGTAYSRYNYSFEPKDINNFWQGMYRAIAYLDSIVNYAKKTKAYYYEATAKILLAVSLGNMTDLCGDIPYSQIKVSDSPRFDTQEQIYQQLFSYLDDAINIINQGNPGEVQLGPGDKIYDWNMDLWRKAAYTLKARYTMHLSKVKSIDYQEIVSDLNNGLASNDDDMRLYFYRLNQKPPIYTKVNSSDAGLANNPYFEQIIGEREDPRYRVLAYDGFWAQGESYFPFVQYTEAMFLKSEAYWHLNDDQDTRESLKTAVKASLDKYLVSDTSWYNDYCKMIDTLNFDTLIYEVYLQKYIDLLYTTEAYNDWRRVDFPEIQPVTGDSIPLRFPYAENELSRNPNAPKWGDDLNLYTPVWWDK